MAMLPKDKIILINAYSRPTGYYHGNNACIAIKVEVLYFLT